MYIDVPNVLSYFSRIASSKLLRALEVLAVP
jgi:hypothetical protein